jgi:hypothetical protein
MGFLTLLLQAVLALSFLQLLCIVALVYLIYLMIRYPDVAIGHRRRTDIPKSPFSLPLLGDTVGAFKHRFWRLEHAELLYDLLAKGRSEVTVASILGQSGNSINTTDVHDVEFVLKDPYMFEKGSFLQETAGPLLGHGIFASDGQQWLQQRKTAAHVFNVKNFRDVFSGEFLREVNLLLGHLEAAKQNHAMIDLQDLFLRATLDGFTRLAMGADLGCMHVKGDIRNGRYFMEDVKFMAAFDYVQNACAARFPNPFWRITEHLDGTRAEIAKCQAVMFKVADDMIAEKRAQMQKEDLVNLDEKVDYGSDYQNMLDYFMRTVNFDGQPPSQEQLRDTVMNVRYPFTDQLILV